MTPQSRRVYVVLCQSWSYNDECYSGDDRPIKAFSLREKAEEYQARCEAAEEFRENPGRQTDTRYTIVEMTINEDEPQP